MGGKRSVGVALVVDGIFAQECIFFFFFYFFFFNDTATTEIYTILFVGSVRCV